MSSESDISVNPDNEEITKKKNVKKVGKKIVRKNTNDKVQKVGKDHIKYVVLLKLLNHI